MNVLTGWRHFTRSIGIETKRGTSSSRIEGARHLVIDSPVLVPIGVFVGVLSLIVGVVALIDFPQGWGPQREPYAMAARLIAASAIVGILIGILVMCNRIWAVWAKSRRHDELLQHVLTATEERHDATLGDGDTLRHRQPEEARRAFQRQTLLELQDAVIVLRSVTALVYAEKSRMRRVTGRWPQSLLWGVDRHVQDVNGRLTELIVRIDDDDLRQKADAFWTMCSQITIVAIHADPDKALYEMNPLFVAVNNRIGELLRREYV